MKGSLIRLLLPVIILLAFGCKKSSSGDESVKTPVNLGLVISLSGNFGPYGSNQENGAVMAVDEINAGTSLPGIKLVLSIRDDKSVPDTCRKVFRDLIFGQNVIAIIGPTSSNAAFAADTVAQNNRVTVMGISNTVPGITEMGDFVFRNSLPESTVIPNTVAVTHEELGYSRVAIIYGNDDPYTLGAYDSFLTSLESTPGVSIVATETVHKGDTLFAAQLGRIISSNPDVIVLATLVNEASKLMIQARALGIPFSIRFLGGNSFNTSRLWQQAGSASQGAVCGTAWNRYEDTPGNPQFVTKYIKRFGAPPDQFAAQAYAAVYIIADAMKRSATLSRQTLRDALAQTRNLSTVLGAFSFDIQRNPVHNPVVQQIDSGEFILFP
jgi:branched-chain amino acid transport system substrate-binding protein